MPSIAILGRKGDIKITWDASDEDSVKKAEIEFKELQRKGFAILTEDGKPIKKFDQDLGSVTVDMKAVAVPPMRGGCA
ncbi:MAG: hypothetical protein KGL39_47720 [Patescibacteria group bacterium]|nr:hypothetical protein [Patescibacteria group bacterium]